MPGLTQKCQQDLMKILAAAKKSPAKKCAKKFPQKFPHSIFWKKQTFRAVKNESSNENGVGRKIWC